MFQAATLGREHRPRSRQVVGELGQAVGISVGSKDFAHRWFQGDGPRRERSAEKPRQGRARSTPQDPEPSTPGAMPCYQFRRSPAAAL